MAILPVLSLLFAVFALSMATELKPVEKRATCPGWSVCGDRCFKLFPFSKTWAEAESYCTEMRGHLASIHNSAEDHCVRLLVGQTGIAWIGGGKSGSAPGWYWTDESPFVFTDWVPGQPDNWRGNEECMLVLGHRNGQWNDAFCYSQYPFVCALV